MYVQLLIFAIFAWLFQSMHILPNKHRNTKSTETIYLDFIYFFTKFVSLKTGMSEAQTDMRYTLAGCSSKEEKS